MDYYDADEFLATQLVFSPTLYSLDKIDIYWGGEVASSLHAKGLYN